MKLTTLKAILSVIAAIVIMLVCQLAAELLGSLAMAAGAPEALGVAVMGIAYTLLGLWLLRLYCAKLLHWELSELRIPRLGFRPVWIAVSLALPLLVSAVYLLLPGKWSVGDLGADNVSYVLAAALLYIGMSAGVVEEVLFRGLVMTVLQRRWNTAAAVIVPSVLFALLHVFNAPLDALSFIQLLLAGTAVGIMFSLITLESGSIWNSALVHAVWNVVIIGRILNIGGAADDSALVSYVMGSDSFLLTGGNFGIEASVVSVAGYAAVIALAAYLMRRGVAATPETAEGKAENG